MEAVVQKWGNEQKPVYKLEDLLSQVTESNIHEEISFGKAKGKEQMLISETIVNSDFEW